MNNKRNSHGSMIVLVMVTLIAMLVIAFVVLNYSQLFATHKEAQTAIDAASLAAAKDMSHIVIDEKDGCYFGVVGLVDDAPRKKDNRPVLSINTLMATVRLDAIIANKLGNSTMLVLAANDLQNVQADCLRLRKKIVQALKDKSFSDKDGNKINILDDANNTFDTNSMRLGTGKRSGNLVLSVGQYASPQGTTNIPVPTPQNLAQVDQSTSAGAGGKTFYKPMVNVPMTFSANGSQGTFNFKFLPIGNDISLVSGVSCEFPDLQNVNNWPGYLPPYLIRAEVDQQVTAAAQPGMKKSQEGGNDTTRLVSSTIHSQAVAACGGPVRTFGTGLLQFSMPGGAPPKGQGPDCTSLLSIMNSSQIALNSLPPEINSQNSNVVSASQLGTASRYTPAWNKNSTGSWMRADGGAVPASNAATLKSDAYRTRTADDPSVVLSYCVYDWLHAMYLRPNVNEIVSKLSANLNLYGSQTTSFSDGQDGPFLRAAYATTKPHYPVTFGLFNVPLDGTNDPRDLRHFDESPAGYRRQLPNVFGYVAADMTLPDQALVVSMDENSNVVTTNGESPQVLIEFYNAIVKTNSIAAQTYKAAVAALKQRAQEIHVLQDKAAAQDKAGDQQALASTNQAITTAMANGRRARAVAGNAHYAMSVTLSMLNERKALSGLGITELNQKKFEMIGGYFFPPTLAATTEQILGNDPIPTGQDGSLTDQQRDWAALPIKDQLQFVLFQSLKQATSSTASPNGQALAGMIQPVFAASTVPQSQNNIYTFKVVGDATQGSSSGGSITMEKPNTTSSGFNVIQGQLIYQNTASLITSSNGSSVQEAWNCIARDNGANYSGSNSFFANSADSGYNGSSTASTNPPLIAEWSLRCPAPVPGPGPASANCTTQGAVSMPIGGGQTQDFITFGNAGRRVEFSSVNTGGSATGPSSSLSQFTVDVDSAGNVTYLYQGVPVHLFGDEASWTNSMTSLGGQWASGVNSRDLFVKQRGGTASSTAVGQQSVPLHDWWVGGSDAISKVTPGTTLTQAQTEAALWSMYSQVTFYTLDANMCAHLYVWSS